MRGIGERDGVEPGLPATTTVLVGTQAGLANTLGTLNEVKASLTVNGDANTDITTLDDTGDTAANTGTLDQHHR